MADRFPLILNTNANQIQEIASGDSLDLTGTNIANAGIITAGNVVIGAATTDLIVNGNARVTGILTVGTSSLKLDGPNNLVNVGTALTLGHTQGLQFHTQNLHSAGFEVNQINASGIITATEADINGDLDVDGHTNLDNVSVAGVSTFTGLVDANGGATIDNVRIGVAGDNEIDTSTGNLTLDSAAGTVVVADNLSVQDSLTVANTLNANGNIVGDNATNITGIAGITASTLTGTLQTASQPNITSVGTLSSLNVSGNVSVGGTLTYEDVTNIDSIGIITARNGLTVSSGTATFQGAIDANGDIDVDGHTNLDNVSIAGVTTASGSIIVAGGGGQLKLFHQSNVDKIESTSAGFHIRQINNGDLHIHAGADTSSSNNRIVARSAGKAELYHDGNLKLSTETGGVNITGVCTATTFVGALTGTASGNATVSSNGDNRIITGGSGNALTGESELTYSTYLNLTRSNSDTNFEDNSAPGGVNGIFIGNSQSTNGVFSAITLAPNDTNGTNQAGSLIAKSVNGGYSPEVHITQRTGNNTTESNIKITSARSVELNYQGTKKLHTNTNGIVVSGGAHFSAASITGTPKLYLYGYAGNDGTQRGVTIEGNEAALEIVSSASGNHSSSILLRNLNDGFAFINDNDENKLTLRQFTAVSDNFNAHGTGNGISGLKTLADFNESGSVDLYWNNNIRIKTHEYGTVLKGGSDNVHIYLQTNDGTQRGEVYANNSNQVGFLDETGNWAVNFDRGGSSYCFSNFLPGADDTYDLGATGTRWRNLYVNDLQLSNEAKKDEGGNDVDGTWGDYTIQEGESDLFLINNRSGKKYKFNLTEVS